MARVRRLHFSHTIPVQDTPKIAPVSKVIHEVVCLVKDVEGLQEILLLLVLIHLVDHDGHESEELLELDHAVAILVGVVHHFLFSHQLFIFGANL